MTKASLPRHSGSRAGLCAAVLLAIAAFASGCADSHATKERFFDCPDCNVILVSLDTLRADRLGAYGYSRGTSPILDRFAAEAVVFRDVLAQAPSTTPSHRSIFSGRYVSEHRNAKTNLPLLAERLRDSGYRTAAFVDGGKMSKEFGLDPGFGIYQESGRPSEFAKAPPTGGLDDLLPKALPWLAEHRRDRFFLFLHTYEVHCPYTPPEPYRTQFTGGYKADFDPAGKCGRDYARMKLRPEELKFVSDLYDGEVRHLDDQLGVLFAALEKMRLYDDTVVIVTADHGESLGERRTIGHNHVYDVQVKVPLMIRVPAARHVEVGSPVASIDIVPTLLALLHIEPDQTLPGMGLAPLVYGRELQQRFRMTESGRLTERSLRLDQRWSLIIRRSRPPELYDLARDPQELVDLSRQQPERVKALLAEFAQRNFQGGTIRELPKDLPAETRRQLKALGYVGN